MSAVLLAVFNDYETAERVRVTLVRDGFPTDRVELTAACELGRAGFEPADSLHGGRVRSLAYTSDQREPGAASVSLSRSVATMLWPSAGYFQSWQHCCK